MTHHPFTADRFIEAFIAKLVEVGEHSVEPKNPRDRGGFKAMVDKIEEAVEKARGPDLSDWLIDLVRLSNVLQCGDTGTFDNLETLLREFQPGYARSPNPYYERVEFVLPKGVASEILDELAPEQDDLVSQAVVAFRDARSA